MKGQLWLVRRDEARIRGAGRYGSDKQSPLDSVLHCLRLSTGTRTMFACLSKRVLVSINLEGEWDGVLLDCFARNDILIWIVELSL